MIAAMPDDEEAGIVEGQLVEEYESEPPQLVAPIDSSDTLPEPE